MGLDVYLYERAQQEASDAHSVAWDAWWERFGGRDEDDPAVKQSKLEHEMGIEGHEADCSDCVKAAVPEYAGSSNVPSEKYPEHLFNRRYLRSSYNGSGFNRAVPDFLGDSERGSLDWIFRPVLAADEYETELTEKAIPGLEQAKTRALGIAEELRKCDPLRVIDATAMLGPVDHLWSQLPTDDEVLAWYRSEKARHQAAPADPFDSDWYSTAKGSIFGFEKGAEMLAMTLGRDILGRPCAMAVYRSEAVDSYIESAEITAEFCDEAIMLIRRDGSAFMHWSS